MRYEYREIFVGIGLFIIANILALGVHYNRFYIILLLGIFFILKGGYKLANKRELLGYKNFVKVYFAFLILGLIADMIFGLWITKLWSYPTYKLLNYILLYSVIYPLGGFVMVYAFSLIESITIKKPRESKLEYKHSLRFVIILGITSSIFFLASVIYSGIYKGFFIYLFFGIAGWAWTNYLTLRVKKTNMLERLMTKSIKYGILILSVAYTQGIIHEFPNVFAREWVYLNFPLEYVQFFGIPLMVVLLGWVALVFIPYSVFELILTLNKVKRFESWEERIEGLK